MDTGLSAQSVIFVPILLDAHASLSAKASLGQFLLFEAKAAEIAAELSNGIRKRRVSRLLPRILPALAEASGMVAALELEETLERVRESLKKDPEQSVAAFNGQAMGQAILLADALSRARMACGLLIDFCEATRIAPNGAMLPESK